MRCKQRAVKEGVMITREHVRSLLFSNHHVVEFSHAREGNVLAVKSRPTNNPPYRTISTLKPAPSDRHADDDLSAARCWASTNRNSPLRCRRPAPPNTSYLPTVSHRVPFRSAPLVPSSTRKEGSYPTRMWRGERHGRKMYGEARRVRSLPTRPRILAC